MYRRVKLGEDDYFVSFCRKALSDCFEQTGVDHKELMGSSLKTQATFWTICLNEGARLAKKAGEKDVKTLTLDQFWDLDTEHDAMIVLMHAIGAEEKK